MLDRPVLGAEPPTGELPAITSPEAVRRASPKRRWLLIGMVAVLLLAGAGVGTWLATKGRATVPGVHVTTKVVTVSTGTMKETVPVKGTIEPAQVSDLDFDVSGTVNAVDVAVGDEVTAGETVATLATTALAAEEAAAQASLTSAVSKLDSDEADGASSAQLAADEATVTSAKDQLTTAEKALAAADLTSPIAGMVASLDVAVGEGVSGSLGNGGTGGTPGSVDDPSSTPSGSSAQVVVESSDSYVVKTTIDDSEVSEVAAGDQVVITPTGSTTPVDGAVASVGMISTSSGGVPSFPVTIDVTGTPSGVYAGSGAQASILVKELHDVVEVPSSAISYHGSRATVTLVEVGGRHVAEAVTVGITDGGETQVVRGLRVDQRIAYKVVIATAPKVHGTSPGGRIQVQTGVVLAPTGAYSVTIGGAT